MRKVKVEQAVYLMYNLKTHSLFPKLYAKLCSLWDANSSTCKNSMYNLFNNKLAHYTKSYGLF